MKILHVTSSYYPATSFGGSVTADFETDRVINNKETDISINVMTTTAGIKDKKEYTKKSRMYSGLKVYFFPILGPDFFSFSISYFWALLKKIKEYDLVHFSGIWNFPVLIGPAICRFYKVPYVITPHGTLYKETFLKNKKYIKKILYGLFVKKNLMFANKVHFTTKDESIKVQEFLNCKFECEIIPYGLKCNNEKYSESDIKAFLNKYGVDDNNFKLLFLGRINWKKGLDILIDTLQLLSERDLAITLMVVGDNQGYLDVVTKNLEDKSKFIHIPHLDGKEKDLAYQSGDLFVLPSYSENFGMTVIEAASHNIPILMSENVGLSDIFKFKKAALICEASTSELFDNIINSYKDDAKLNLIKKNANDLFQADFTMESVSIRFITMYKKILDLK